MSLTATPQIHTQLTQCAHKLIEEQAAQKPAAVALIQGSRRWTYSELDEASNRVAGGISQMGIGAGMLVGVYADSSPEAIVALLGVLKAGCGFVPFDPTWPPGRVEWMIADAGVTLVLATDRLLDRVSNETVKTVSVSHLLATDPGAPQPSSKTTANDISCVLYTSGSSGQPKGVVREHRSVVSRLAWTRLKADDVSCHNMSLCYGLSQERLFVPLMKGLPLVILPDEAHKDASQFAEAVAEFGITNVTVVPAFLEQMVGLNEIQRSHLKSLQTVAVGSAPLSISLVRRVREVLPHITLVNAYGGTEAGSVARGEVADADGPVTIGRPVANAEIYILDENLVQVPNGEIGELCVGGPSIARGYLRRPELTAERFIPNPFRSITPSTLYRTGDRGRYLPDGRIELTGRADRQVKVRGYRVELGEVEAVLAQHRDVQETIFVGQAIGSDNRVIAYVALRDGVQQNVTSLREHLRDRVPDHMLPSSYVFLPALPRTPIGKIDTSALPTPGATRPHLDNPYVDPRNALEHTIASIWAEILDVDAVGIHDHFLDLGGDSLQAVRIAAAIETQLGRDLGAESVFEHPTVAELAAALADRGADVGL